MPSFSPEENSEQSVSVTTKPFLCHGLTAGLKYEDVSVPLSVS